MEQNITGIKGEMTSQPWMKTKRLNGDLCPLIHSISFKIAKKDTSTSFHEANAKRLLRLMSLLSKEKPLNNALQSVPTANSAKIQRGNCRTHSWMVF